MFHAKVVQKTKTHILCSVTFLKNRAVYEICGKKRYSRTGDRRKYGACALHAGWL